MGMVFDRDSLEASNTLRQSMQTLQRQVKTVATQFAVELIPVLNKYVIPAIRDYLIPGFKVAAKVIKISLTPAIAGLKAAFAAIEPFIEPLQKALIKMYNVWVDVINRLQPYLSALGYDFEKLEHLSADAFKRNEKAMEDTARGAQNAADQYGQAAEQMQQASGKIPSWAGNSGYIKPMLQATGAKNIAELRGLSQEQLEAASDKAFGSGDGKISSNMGSVASGKSSGEKNATAAVNSMKSQASTFHSRLLKKLDTINRSINNIDVRVSGSGGSGSFGFRDNINDINGYQKDKAKADESGSNNFRYTFG
jgi:hypothetical protein